MPVSLPFTSRSTGSGNEASVTFPLGIKALYEPSNAVVDIIFCTVSLETAKGRGEVNIFWPQELIPKKLPNAQILTFGYDAYVTRVVQVTQNKIRDHALDLVNQVAAIRNLQEASSRPIIFIVHSLRGIVCKDALLVSTNSVEPHLQAVGALTRAILFAATPHEGSSIADLARIPASVFGIIKKTNLNLLTVLQTRSEV
jgi:hypothetical protein